MFFMVNRTRLVKKNIFQIIDTCFAWICLIRVKKNIAEYQQLFEAAIWSSFRKEQSFDFSINETLDKIIGSYLRYFKGNF